MTMPELEDAGINPPGTSTQGHTSPIYVTDFVTGGSGTALSPWTGWDTAITWAANSTYYFPAGYYAYTDWPNTSFPNIRFIGEGALGYPDFGTVLVHGGTGDAVLFDAGAGPAVMAGVYMEGFVIQGNAATTNGLHLRGIVDSTFKLIRATSCSAAGLYTQYIVDCHFEQFVCSINFGGWGAATPVNGIVLDVRTPPEGSNANVFTHPIIEGVTGSGIVIIYGFCNYFEGGTVESNTTGSGVGIELQANANCTSVECMDFEQNTSYDAIIGGIGNVFTACQFGSVAAMHFIAPSSTGKNNTITGGVSNGTILIDSGVLKATFLNHYQAGVVTNNGTTTTFFP